MIIYKIKKDVAVVTDICYDDQTRMISKFENGDFSSCDVPASSSIIKAYNVGYESGVYLVEVTVNGQKATKRLIIK